ncbi:uncharacterized protein [Zea mays]|uniref:Uncharacterized protein n=1 Tax=Zea mays TaxID=4577 RepID=C0HIX5_MAIZE|nr:uncharacterized protein LOC111590564 [Zea mays]ACN26978.1 unknown [Zea mays]|eukprot:XP_023157115.1 uncharacterized protein LOC111590564 [Zea mays]
MHCLYASDVLIIPHLNWSHPGLRRWLMGWPSNPLCFQTRHEDFILGVDELRGVS